MYESLSDQIVRLAGEAALLYHRLVLVVGLPGSGKTPALQEAASRTGGRLINVNLELSRQMLDLTESQRALHAGQLLGEIVEDADTDVVLLDNMEMLFDATLQLNPLQILQALSRNVTIVAAWSGTYTDGVLFYAEAWHPEYRRYPLAPQDAVIVPIADSLSHHV